MPQSIVVLDSHTLNPGDLTWEAFESLGQLTLYDRTDAGDILARAQGATYVLTNKVPLSAQTLAKLPKLKYIGVLATGYNVVDVKAANDQGIIVTNVPTYGSDSVAQHTIALILECARHIGDHRQAVAQGKWSASPDFCFAVAPIIELTGKTLAIVGLGKIGQAVARIAAAMGMRLMAPLDRKKTAQALDGLSVQYVDWDTFFSQADVLTLHCPLVPATQHLVSAPRLAQMRPTAFVINTSRGPLVDQVALAHALQTKQIAGAGLDVLDAEPPAADHPLAGIANCIITPHVAWYAVEARARLMQTAADNLKAFIAGEPVNQVNG